MLRQMLGVFLTDAVVDYLSMLLPLLFMLLGLTFAVTSDAYISKKHRWVLLVIVFMLLALIWQNNVENRVAQAAVLQPLRLYVSILGYCLRPMILVLFCYIVDMERAYWAAWGLIAVNILVHMTALWSDVCFSFTADNHYLGGPLSNFCLYISLVLMAYLLFISLRKYWPGARGRVKLIAFNLLLIILALVLDGSVGSSTQPVTFLTIAMVCASLFFYIWLHLQFVREHERELTDGQNLQLMLSQIQPHFMINSLEVIRNLCRTNPEAAEGAMMQFEKYLRGNMDSLTQKGMIPLRTELEHTRQYLALEKLRFSDEMNVIWDLPVTDFVLPTLTVQPIVENAVRHGVRGSSKGSGTVTIATRELADHYEVIVSDDGPGFDPHAALPDDRLHIGLQNVRQRLEQAGGSLQISSKPGKGTSVTVSIPRRSESEG